MAKQMGPLREFSVVYTDRSYNHMSPPFQEAMRDILSSLKVVVIPGSGSYGMEAVARQFVANKTALVLRNGYFSYRWTDLFTTGRIPSREIVLTAEVTNNGSRNPQFIPHPIEKVIAVIKAEKPACVFAPHVESSLGLLLPDDYIKKVADAVHSVGGMFVLDGIAGGNLWVDMKKLGVDAYLSAPQKGWSGPACCGVVMMSATAEKVARATESDSLCINLKRWLGVMDAYEKGGHAYHTTMPTDALMAFRDVIKETEAYGPMKLRDHTNELGTKVRQLLESRGYQSAAAEGFKAPVIVVSHADDGNIAANFLKIGVQISAGVGLKINEPEGMKLFRIGLFGLEKLTRIDETVEELKKALDRLPSRM